MASAANRWRAGCASCGPDASSIAYRYTAVMTGVITQLHPGCVALLQRHNLLRTLVEREISASAVETIVLDEQEQQQSRQAFCQQNGLTSSEALVAFAARFGLDGRTLDDLILRPARVRKHCLSTFMAKAEAHFLARKHQLDRVVYSLLRVKDHALARELYFRIASAEANFADLAATYAEGPERNTKGIVGPVPLTQAHPQLAEQLRTSSPGVLMEPFAISEWWLVARLESYTPASFDQATAQHMAQELFDTWVKEETDAQMEQWRQLSLTPNDSTPEPQNHETVNRVMNPELESTGSHS
jgi:parvulin-like peptidyl-prolyl isomerase